MEKNKQTQEIRKSSLKIEPKNVQCPLDSFRQLEIGTILRYLHDFVLKFYETSYEKKIFLYNY